MTSASVTLALAAGSLGGYAIARFRLRFGLERWVGLSLLTLRIVPPVVILIPVYLFMLQLDLLDTWLGLILTYTALNVTFCVWMMESFFREIPIDLEEAAMVDGNSRLTAFRRITLPLAAPARRHRDLRSNRDVQRVPVRAGAHRHAARDDDAARHRHADRANRHRLGLDGAAGVIGALPIVVFALLVQRHLVRGLTLGAVK